MAINLSQKFIWFTGQVENIDDDPDMLFNVRVRVLGHHDLGIETDSTLYCQPLLPLGGSSQGAGDTPIMSIGSQVFGFFRDDLLRVGEKQFGVIIGSYPIIPDGNMDKHSIHWNAREKNVINKPKEYRPEFDSSYKAKYPFNRVIASKSGHIIEIDDTAGEERLHVYHKAGTYIEINKDGRVVIKCINDSYELVNGNKELYVKGDYTIKADGNINLFSSKNSVDITAAGTVSMSSGRKVLVNAGDGMTIAGSTEVTIKTPGGLNLTDGGIQSYGPVTSLCDSGDFTTDEDDIQMSIFGYNINV